MSVWVADSMHHGLGGLKTVKDDSLLVAVSQKLVIGICLDDCMSTAAKSAERHRQERSWANVGCSHLALSQPVQEHFINQL